VSLAVAGIVFAPALALGSFLNVVAARVPLRRSVVRPKSACMSCATELVWHDNIPLVSWAILRGRCRTCSVRIPARYPAVELATGLLIAGCVLKFGLTGRAAVAAFFCAVLVAITATDMEHLIIPNRIVVPAAAIVLAAQTALDPSIEWLLSGLALALFLFLALLAYPAGMGMGDVKFALLMGAALGRYVSVAFAVALVSSMVPSLFLLARHGMKARKMKIPFGVFLAICSVVALFAGKPLLDTYLNTFVHH
jgi:leader peptidase (prepilin peptidase) / N-methyltransferase